MKLRIILNEIENHSRFHSLWNPSCTPWNRKPCKPPCLLSFLFFPLISSYTYGSSSNQAVKVARSSVSSPSLRKLPRFAWWVICFVPKQTTLNFSRSHIHSLKEAFASHLSRSSVSWLNEIQDRSFWKNEWSTKRSAVVKKWFIHFFGVWGCPPASRINPPLYGGVVLSWIA